MPETGGPEEDSNLYLMRLTSGQLRLLIERLGGSAEDEGTLVDSLLALLVGPDPA